MRCARIWRWRARNVWRSSPAIIWPKPSARWEMSCLCARINSDHRAYVVEAHEAAVAHPSPRSLRAKASSNGPLSRSLATKTISKLHLAAGFLRRPFLRGLRKPPSHEAAKSSVAPIAFPRSPENPEGHKTAFPRRHQTPKPLILPSQEGSRCIREAMLGHGFWPTTAPTPLKAPSPGTTKRGNRRCCTRLRFHSRLSHESA
jgi:hypothetical protein